MTSLRAFLQEYISYLTAPFDQQSIDATHLQGVGYDVVSFPDLFTVYNQVRGLVYLTWKSSEPINEEDKSKSFTYMGSSKLVPYRVEKDKNSADQDEWTHYLYLPLAKMEAPLTSVLGDVKTFRPGYSGGTVNVVVYRDTPPIMINMSMFLRNNIVYPWAGYFSFIIKHLKEKGYDINLCLPRLYFPEEGDTSSEAPSKIKGTVVTFTISNSIDNVTTAMLAFLPDATAGDFLFTAGLV